MTAIFSLVFCLFSLPLLSHAQTSENPSIYISEVAWAGSSLSNADEWVELTNLSDQPTDLSGWMLLGATSGEETILFPEGTQIEPSHTFLLSNYDCTHEKSSLSVCPNLVNTALSLSNSGLALVLQDDAGTQIDVAGNGSTPFAGYSGGSGENLDGRYTSMVRVSPITQGDLSSAWTSAVSSQGFKEGMTELGTPGVFEEVEANILAEKNETTTEETTTTTSEAIQEEENSETEEVVVEGEEIIFTEGMADELTEIEEQIVPVEEVISAEETDQETINDQIQIEDISDNSTNMIEEETEENLVSETLLSEITQESNETTQENATDETTTSEEVLTQETIETYLPPLRITEFVSDPMGGTEEFIEIENITDNAVFLTGYYVTDATGKPTTLPDEILEPGAFIVISKPNGKLNNDGDTISLLDVAGLLIDEVSYGTEALPAISDPYVYALDEFGNFVSTTIPTPGKDNIISTEIVEEEVIEEETQTTNEEIEEIITETENLSIETEQVILDEETQETNLPSYSFGALVINEFVCDPVSGEDEWIELYNTSSETVSLTGMIIQDATERSTSLPEGELTPGTYHVIVKPKGQLNNGGDTITLFDAQGTILDSLTYGTEEIPTAPDPFAIARQEDGTFVLTSTPTPGSHNQISLEIQEDNTEATETEQIEETMEETTSTITATETTSTTTTTTEINSTISYLSLHLSEIYPNTEGSDEYEEFIEIENTGETTIDLYGIILEDASGKSYHITEHVDLTNVDFFTLWRTDTAITLNNLGDSVRLLDPDGTLIDEVSYEKATKGFSLARINGAWNWTENPTPDEQNRFPQERVEQTSTSTTSTNSSSQSSQTLSGSTTGTNTSSSNSVKTTSTTTIGSLKTLADETSVSLTGIVLVEPGILGKQIFYVGQEGEGVQIYQYNSDFPDLSVGDTIQITGILSTTHGERRVKVSDLEGITVLSSSANLSATPFDFTHRDEAVVGTLVQATGFVSSRDGSTIILEEDGVELTIKLSSYVDIPTSLFVRGSRVSVTGILSSSDGTLRLLPRSQEDVVILSSLEQQEQLVTGSVENTTSQNHFPEIALVLTLAVLVGLALRSFVPRLITSYASRRSLRFRAEATN